MLFFPIVLGSIQPKTVLLLPGQTCEDFFLEYKEKQDRIYSEIDDDKSFLSDENLNMPSFIIVCKKYNPTFASIYFVSKTGEFHTEQKFFMNFLMKKLEEEDKNIVKKVKKEINQKHENVEKKRSKSHNLKKIDLDGGPSKKEQNKGNNLIKIVTSEKKNIETKEDEYDSIAYQIFIYMVKSPCAMCFKAYQNLIKKFTKLKIKVFFSSFFKFNNDLILFEKNIRNLEVTVTCLNEIKEENKNLGYKNHNNYYYFNNDFERRRILDCINQKTISAIKSYTQSKNLSFNQISVKSRYSSRIKDLKNILGIL